MTIRSETLPTTYAPLAAQRTAAAPAALQAAHAPARLDAAEQRAVSRQFPESPGLALRLYGPPQGAATPAAALGTRLDLRG